MNSHTYWITTSPITHVLSNIPLPSIIELSNTFMINMKVLYNYEVIAQEEVIGVNGAASGYRTVFPSMNQVHRGKDP